jgi:hypothetical protein
MPNTLSIDLLQTSGACQKECIALRQVFPDGTIIFDMSLYPQLRDKKINVMWAGPLLPLSAQVDLALSWYDRGLAGQAPDWKADLRALIAVPVALTAATQLSARLVDRRSIDPSSELAVAVAGIGYAAAAFASKFAEDPIDKARTQSAIAVLAQWCARSTAAIESVAQDVVLDEFQSSVFQKLEQYGATL